MSDPSAQATYHLVPETEWGAADPLQDYAPSTFEAEGFIHCTDGERELIATANRYYREQPGHFLALQIGMSLVHATITYEDPGRIYPHIHGRLNRDAIVSVHRVERAHDGTFLALASLGGATLDATFWKDHDTPGNRGAPVEGDP